MDIDRQIDAAFQPIAETVANIVFYAIPVAGNDVKLILIWLVAAALFFTFYFGFVNFRYFLHAISVLQGKHDNDKQGDISRFEALATSLSGTVGLGNIAGVAVAISIGGPGAALWMVVMAFFSMSTKFMEVTCAVKYRVYNEKTQDHISGGPMYYIKRAFEKRKMPWLGTLIAGVFAICCVGGSLGGGNMFQANQAFQQVYNIAGGENGFLAGSGWLFGLGLSILVGLVIVGGIHSIASVSSRLVPAMGLIYIAAGFIVIGLHFQNIPDAFQVIAQGAFTPEAGLGGLLGVLLVGVQRAAFSNEAGLGSAAIVHSAAKTDEPVTQGFVAMLGPFIDTVIICTITALIIIISGAYLDADGVEGVALTSRAMESGVSWFPYVLTLTVFLFAYSTLITWFYYGLKGISFLFGDSTWVSMSYKIVYLLCIIIGSSSELDSIILFTDAMILSMGIPNIIGLYLLAPEIRKDLSAYADKLKSIKLAKAVG